MHNHIRPKLTEYIQGESASKQTIPISSNFYKSLPIKKGKVFKNGYKTLKNLSFKLPTGQMSHVLRHTFASHFIQNGGNILVLQKILGHSSLLMTMRYAHLAPEHLEETIKLNPIDNN
jgi:integrase